MSRETIAQSGDLTTEIVDKSNANFTELYSGTPRASSLGLSESNTATQNREALRTACAANESIYIDGMFPMNTVTGWIDPGDNLTLVGNGASGFVMEGGSSLFRPGGSNTLFRLNNLTFESLVENLVYFSADSEYTEIIDVQNCKFNGTITGSTNLLKIVGGDYNPATTDAGCRSITIRNNIVKNSYNEFMRLEDCPTKIELIENNVITNLNGTFYFANKDNGSVNYGDDIINVKENTIIRNNKVLNDVDFFPISCPSAYMALTVIESKSVLYTGNVVSGLKTAAEQPIYDAYLTAGHVTYKDNVWLNNVCFDATAIINNQLIKGKSNNSTDILIPTRIYENNLWRVEDAWILASGKTTADTWNNFSEFAPNSDIVFRNNIIDVKGLVTETTETDINSIIFDDNVIRFESIKANGGFLRYSPVNLSTKENSISRNNIQVLSSDTNVEFFDSNISDGTWNTIYFNDNIIECDNESFTYLLSGIRVTNLIMNNNNININTISTFFGVIATNFRGNNNIDIALSTSYIHGEASDLGIETMDFEMTSYNEGETRISVQNIPTDETWSELYITLETGLGVSKFMTKYRIFFDTVWKFQTYNSSDVLTTEAFGGANITPKIKDLGDYDSGMTLSFVNSSIPAFRMISEPSGVIKKIIRHKTFLGSGDFANLLS